MRKVVFIFLCLIGLGTTAFSQTERVLFIGNSYTLLNNLPQLTASVASSAGDQLIIGSSAIASYSLQMHSQDATTLSLIRQGGWDYVVLQEYSQYPSELLSWVQSNVFPYAQYLTNEVNAYNAGARVMYYMTWGRRDGDAERCSRLPSVCTYEGMDDLTRERYMMMAENYNGVVSPVGAVWRYIRQNYPSIELYISDGSHPSEAGSYAAACCFYTAIFKKDPTLITYNYTLDSSTASIIRSAVRAVVFNNMSAWYLGQSSNFTIYSSAGSGGTISPSGTQTVSPGSSITFYINPNSGNYINNVTVDNVSVGAVSSYTFSSVSSNHTINATFGTSTYTITSSAGSGGSISPSGTQTVSQGGSLSFSINPNSGYFIYDVTVDNVSVGSVSNYTFSSVSSNHTINASFRSTTYTITSSASSGGSISPSGTQSLGYGASASYSITPQSGYYIYDVTVDNISVGAVSGYTFSSITANHTINATFRIITYTMTSSAGTGGSINPSGTSTVNYGSGRTYTITPSTGYVISDVRVDNVSMGPITSYTFSNITANHTIRATFAIITFSINAASGSNGSITPGSNMTVNYGSDQTFTITPNTGYYISNVIVDNVSVGQVASYTFENITSNHTISASFSILRYSLTATSGSGGSVTPAGISTVDYGSNLTYTITPSTGYRIVDVKIDNVSAGAISTYTFSGINANHTISAEFTILTYTMNSSAGSNGTISPNGTRVVNYGSDQKYSVTPATGYYISDVMVDNVSAGPVADYTFSHITQNHTIRASFSIMTFVISTVSNNGGSVIPSGNTTVNYGDDLTVSFTPDYGYRIKEVTVDGTSKGKVESFGFNDITANHNISVVFEPIPVYTISALSGTGGSVTPSGSTDIFEGLDLSYTIVPDAGFRILDVSVDNVSVGKVNDYTFINIMADHYIKAEFTSSSDIDIYPNPSGGNIFIKIDSPYGFVFDLEISDFSGRLIYSQQDIPGNVITPVVLSCSDGIYLARFLMNGKRVAIQKLIISGK